MKSPTNLVLLLLALTSCADPEPALTPGTLRTWGTLREALRDGHTEARVDVADLAGPGLFALGAAAGLDGEITIVDGACYVSRVREGRVQTERSTRVAATILFAADVPKWRTIAVTEDVDPSGLEAFIAKCAQDAGLDTRNPFPFLVEGELLDMEMHVLAGECPIRAQSIGVAMTSPPLRRQFDRVRGRLVGIHASDGGGVITHHGSATHVHAIVSSDGELTGHCDAVGIAAGAMVRLPDGWAKP